jgi:hypothetical protein
MKARAKTKAVDHKRSTRSLSEDLVTLLVELPPQQLLKLAQLAQSQSENLKQLGLASVKLSPTNIKNSAGKRPSIFLGSSTEGLPIAKAVQLNLDNVCEATIWSQGFLV